MTRSRRYELTVGDTAVQVERKAVRYLRLRVRGDGQTRLSAPLRASDAEVRRFLDARADWIRHQQQRLAASAPAFALDDGERLPFVDGRLRLHREEGAAACWRDGEALWLRLPAGSDRAARRRLLLRWYRAALDRELRWRLPERAAAMQLACPDWGIRNMASRWGSCNPSRRRISLALRLIGQPAECLDYVLVHELAHLRVTRHDDAFWAEVARAMPRWRDAHDALRSAPSEPGLWR